eukprot:65617-Chlamydomonas_euryale.AAC.1
MMRRAMGGAAGFACMSPSVLLRGAAAAAAHAAAAATNDPSALPRHWDAFELAGDAIPVRSGLHNVGREASPSAASSAGAGGGGGGGECSAAGGGGVGDGGGGGEVRRVASHLPPTYVMSSCADHMVPWHEGAEFTDALSCARAPARHLIYNHVLHSDFVMSWKP